MDNDHDGIIRVAKSFGMKRDVINSYMRQRGVLRNGFCNVCTGGQKIYQNTKDHWDTEYYGNDLDIMFFHIILRSF